MEGDREKNWKAVSLKIRTNMPNCSEVVDLIREIYVERFDRRINGPINNIPDSILISKELFH